MYNVRVTFELCVHGWRGVAWAVEITFKSELVGSNFTLLSFIIIILTKQRMDVSILQVEKITRAKGEKSWIMPRTLAMVTM